MGSIKKLNLDGKANIDLPSSHMISNNESAMQTHHEDQGGLPMQGTLDNQVKSQI